MTYQRLAALDLRSVTPADVDAIVGFKGWVEEECDGCGQYVGVAIQVGKPPDVESSTATLCLSCFDAAVKLRKTITAGTD